MELIYGTREEHIGTLRRAKENGVTSAWTGDIRRNVYLRENLAFAEEEGIIAKLQIEENYEGQYSDFVWEWLDHPELAD